MESFYSENPLQALTYDCVKTNCFNPACRGRLCENYLSKQTVLLNVEKMKKSLESESKNQIKQ